MTGEEVRVIIKKKRLRQWEVAQELGIGEFTLSRWLRGRLTEEHEKAVLTAIDRLAERIKGTNTNYNNVED